MDIVRCVRRLNAASIQRGRNYLISLGSQWPRNPARFDTDIFISLASETDRGSLFVSRIVSAVGELESERLCRDV